MAEEDIIFGKNRHFFGGIEPSNMLKFTTELTDDSSIKIKAELPTDTVIDGQTLCTVAGAIIRRRTDRYPNDEFDGDLVADLKKSSTFIDSTATDEATYYYGAFPYTTQGVYNRSEKNRTSATIGLYGYLFGYDLDLDNSQPAHVGTLTGRVTYPDDVDNRGYEPAGMNFTNNTFNYGSWPSEAGVKFMPKPCMLKYDGVVDHYLNPNDYSKKIDGSGSSVADISGFGGNAMMEWPKIYTKRWESEDGVYHFRCCDVKLDSSYECWCNYDKNDNEIDHFYTAIYSGVSSDKNGTLKTRSISGVGPANNLAVTTSVHYASANGDDWYIETLADRLLIQDLLVMMAKSTDGQTAYGRGFSSSSYITAVCGTLNDKGLFWGDNAGGAVKVFGMENWWGEVLRPVAGWINKKGYQYVKITRGTKDGSTASDYNLTGDGYIKIDTPAFSDNSSGWISGMKSTLYGRLPKSFTNPNGSSSTYEADYCYYSNSDGPYYARVGGQTKDNYTEKGIFTVNLTLDAYNGSGITLSCKPSK